MARRRRGACRLWPYDSRLRPPARCERLVLGLVALVTPDKQGGASTDNPRSYRRDFTIAAPYRRILHNEAPSCAPTGARRSSRSPPGAPRTASTGALSATWPTAPHSPRPSTSSSWPDPAETHPSPSGSPVTPQCSTCQTPTSTSRPRAHRRPSRFADPAQTHRRGPAAARPGRSGARRRPAFAPPALPRTTPGHPERALAAHLDRPSTRALTPRASTALPPGALRS
jgi:hypothetical protein